jgi:hypothetical protein
MNVPADSHTSATSTSANFGSHWIMEERPDATVKAVSAFLNKK